MKFANALLTALIAALVAFGVGHYVATPATQGEAKKETAFERVMRTRTLRCAYVVRPPHIMIDANTKQLSGIDHDIIEEIGKNAGLKIEWQDEVGYGAFPDQLSSGKQDIFCSLVLIGARRAQRVDLTNPVTFMPLYAYTNEANTSFDNNLDSANKKDVKFAVIDGSSQKAATDAVFPEASQYALPGDSDNSQTMLAVATHKADIVIADDNTVLDFNAHNPDNKLRRVPSDKPVRIYAEGFSVAKGETALRDFLNTALQELNGNGVTDRLIAKYQLAPGAILRVNQPYASEP